MIPEFPNFKKLELTDREEVEKITSKFPPYSDFNFASLLVWNISNNIKISLLNNNLIIVFNGYLSEKPFLSFIGKNKIIETASELIEFSKKNYKLNSLKLIPEEISIILEKSGFKITPDIDSNDYIYSVNYLANMNSWPRSSSGKRIRQFIKMNPDYIVKQSSVQEILKDEYIKMFERWAKNKKIENHFELNEYKAFRRFLQIEEKNMKVISLYVKNVLIGFTVYEILSNEYAISHFAKADTEHHSSVYNVLNWEEAKILDKAGVKYYNWEQDLGIHGLRYSKNKYKPSFFLKQFIISRVVDE